MGKNWLLLVYYAVGAGTVAAINLSTPNPLPFVIVSFLVVYFGLRILERLTHVPTNAGLSGQSPDHYLCLETDYVYEKRFSVWFVDGKWEAGRAFEMSGKIVTKPDSQIDGLTFGQRFTVEIYPLAVWFPEARIGWVRDGKCSIGLPIELADQLLADIRNEKRQLLSIGFKVDTNKEGKPCFPAYLFEFERPLD
jgi:hypothetical protein